ncbi:hypothetical protein JTE90_008649 [Oedothorax gibbosus]|uniref:Uncharacterized protein n=1 Tax=Oedothorax gibbosus TaxID=931172 RepID=A0AAV6TZF5_9ARAC|nr:hypothetical protein JTE90_008649 [Oedothorax gibbosus]
MTRYLSYKEEMKRLDTLLAEVSTDEESLDESDGDREIIDKIARNEDIDEHKSSSEDLNSSDSETDTEEYFVAKEKNQMEKD